VIKFAKEGFNIITCSRKEADLLVLKEEVEKLYSNKVHICAADLSKKSDVDKFGDFVTKTTSKVDVLVNNAGITKDNLILRMTEEQWDDVITTNLKSVFNYSRAVARPMMKNRGGSIINISSVVGISGNGGQTNYSASKAGIIGFTKSYAKELSSRNIRANVIAPGYILTDMTDQLDEKVLEGIKAELA
jgi:3-oxoacyl-[acyl-carrier protein] reductase